MTDLNFLLDENNYFATGRFELENKDFILVEQFIRALRPELVFDFGCFSKDAKVVMSDYTEKNIGELKEGDSVLTHTGEAKPIISVFRRHFVDDLINLTCTGLPKCLSATPEHPILAIKRMNLKCKKHCRRICKPELGSDFCQWCNKQLPLTEFIAIKDLRKGDYVLSPKPKEFKFTKLITLDYVGKYKYRKVIKKIPTILELTPELMRIFGYWLAEGSLVRSHKHIAGISFCFNINEGEYIYEIRDTIKAVFGMDGKICIRPAKNIVEISFYSKELGLLFFELFNQGSHTKKIHPDILKTSDELSFELVKGFYNGDGHFYANKTQMNINLTTVSENLRNQLYWLLVRNEELPLLNERKIMISGDCQRLDERAKKPSRKLSSTAMTYYGDYLLRPIKKIDKISFNGTVFNLGVEDDNSYVVNKIAVHNCGRGKHVHVFNYYNIPAEGYEPSKIARERSIGLAKDKLFDSIPSKVYDCVWCCDVMEHIKEDVVDYYLEMLFKMTGRFALFSICLEGDPNYVKDPTHMTCKPRNWWEAELRKAGFELLEIPDFWIFKHQLFLCQKGGFNVG